MAQKQLTPVERQFIKEYLKPSNQFNATQAYLKIKPSVKLQSAMTLASAMLAKSHIKLAIQKYQDTQIANTISSKEYLIKQAHRIGIKAEKADKLNTALSSVEVKAKLNQVYQQDTQGQEDYTNMLAKLVVVQGDLNVNTQNNVTLPENDSQV